MSASGLAAVWAEENTREAIFRAFQRGEIYATTGTRIALRVRALSQLDPTATVDELIQSDEIEGVPMGGLLERQERAPSLLIEATKDPRGANLDRVQVIKGWLEEGGTFEQVYDVVWSGERVRASDGTVPAVRDPVDRETGRASGFSGTATLTALWTDPDFKPEQPAFYYVRVLEVPSPRHSTLDAIALGLDPGTTGHPVTIQERAYGSPIHYRP